MKRDFTKWLSSFRDSIATYSYYVDFEKIYKNVDKVKVELGKKTEVEIIANDKITVLSKKSEEKRNITYKANIDKIVAPVKKGDKVGTIDIIEDNKIIGTVEATVKEDIAKANIFAIFYRNLKNTFNGNLLLK